MATSNDSRSPPTPHASTPRPRRFRTEAQLIRKRQDDREAKKYARAESKMRMKKMEEDLAYIRRCVGAWEDSPWRSATFCQYANGTAYPTSMTASVARNGLVLASDPKRAVDCRCGIEHPDQQSCLEFSVSTLLLQNHSSPVLPQLAMAFPRDPSLANVLGYARQDNMLVSALNGFFKIASLLNTETHFGLYFLAYRLLRVRLLFTRQMKYETANLCTQWRLWPDASIINDVPAWLRPTKIQETTPHPVVIDFIPWPGLRDYLCQNQNQDSRHSVALFVSSLRMDWPTDEQVVCKMPGGEMGVNGMLDAVSRELGNWRLEGVWVETFPQLAKFLV